MIITTDLRAAIRSAEKAQPAHFRNYQERQAKEEAALKTMAALPKNRRKVALAVEQLKEAARLSAEADKTLSALGVGARSNGSLYLANDEAFIKAGGVIHERLALWKFDAVMAELAAAHPTALRTILKKYGINWA